MNDLLDPANDDHIRSALRALDAEGKLGGVAATIYTSDGEQQLRRIMNSTDELGVMDRGMLTLHLLGVRDD